MLREVDLGTLFQKAPTKKTSYLREVDIQPMFASASLLREIPVASMFHEGDDTAEIAEMLTKSLSKPKEQVASWKRDVLQQQRRILGFGVGQRGRVPGADKAMVRQRRRRF